MAYDALPKSPRITALSPNWIMDYQNGDQHLPVWVVLSVLSVLSEGGGVSLELHQLSHQAITSSQHVIDDALGFLNCVQLLW
ncbi:hypothetical protein [Pseudochrobactrum sp. AO18b]|uniref:hypothetical protein n=1 Tax=Pseudochrobactrum sp. AO18b TaxID=1201036 RepID=UPI0012EB0DA1|nr:hypothetical protein [Pseudochrobactrum sp. AO18b]